MVRFEVLIMVFMLFSDWWVCVVIFVGILFVVGFIGIWLDVSIMLLRLIFWMYGLMVVGVVLVCRIFVIFFIC